MPAGFNFSLIGLSMSRIEKRLHEVMDPACDVSRFLEVASRIYVDAVVNQIAPVKKGAPEYSTTGVATSMATRSRKR